MSLNWNIENIVNYMDIAPGGDVNADGSTTYKNGGEGVKTWGLIMLTIGLGLPGITEENKARFFARTTLYTHLFGSVIHLDGKEYTFTPEDIDRRVGMTTNVSHETDSAWLKRMSKLAHDNALAYAEASFNKATV